MELNPAVQPGPLKQTAEQAVEQVVGQPVEQAVGRPDPAGSPGLAPALGASRLSAKLEGAKAAAPVPAPAPGLRMPDFATGTFAHRHTVHSALTSLAAMGLAAHRIQLRRSGREALPAGTVVRQRPAPGTLIDAATVIELHVAGLGFMHSLPVGMWDSGGESAMGTRELLELFDDPMEKLRHWFHEGAPLFRIAPGDPAACARWLALFGVRAEDWPRPLWYRLASLIASMPQLSCSEAGCAFVLDVLLGLPVLSFTRHRSFTVVGRPLTSTLAGRSSRLGVDLVMGDQVEDLAVLSIEIGPVPLSTYEQYTAKEEGVALLAQTLAMVMPASTSFDLKWSVLDQSRSPRLGLADHNARLGINTHMGSAQTGPESSKPAARRISP